MPGSSLVPYEPALPFECDRLLGDMLAIICIPLSDADVTVDAEIGPPTTAAFNVIIVGTLNPLRVQSLRWTRFKLA